MLIYGIPDRGTMIKPKKLNYGDKVAVVAPSSATDLKSVENGELKLRSLGLNPVMFPTCYTNYGHLSASDEERARDINDSFRDESIKGIICLRGGYGTTRILNMLDYEMIKRNSIYGKRNSIKIRGRQIIFCCKLTC